MNKMETLFKSIREVMKKKNYVTIFLVSSLVFLILLVSIPIFTIPGNSLSFQLRTFTPLNYLIMVVFSALVGLMISMRTYNYKMKRSMSKISGGVFGGFFGFAAGILGTGTCPTCFAAIFGFLGAGTTLFLIEKQWYIMSFSALFLILSIYLTSLSIERKCEKCQ